MFARLPERENRTGWILNYSHPTYGHHVERSLQYSRAFSFRLFGAFVDVGNRNVAEPVRWNSLRLHIRPQLVKCADFLAVELEHCVDAIRTHRMVFIIPPEELCVKILRRRAISCSQLNPTKRTRLIFGCLLHSCFTHLDQSSLMNRTKTRGERFCFSESG